tara:strand:+ start:4477 stop:4842 length:366 start_codon:yes stop_codon:yes gene_type:complete
MKKLVFVCIFLGFVTQAFAQISEKQLMGTWKYTVMTDQGPLTGVLNFDEKEGKIAGEVVSSEGQSWNMDSLELREENIVYFEIVPEAETFVSTLKFEGDAFEGMTGPSHTQFTVTGERLKE